jgi:hypothetical protein
MMRLSAALFCLIVAACVTSPVPITSHGDTPTDARLSGTWQFTLSGGEDEREKPSIMTLSQAGPGELHGEIKDEDARVENDARFRVVLAKIRGQTYASLTFADDMNGERQYMLLRYEFRGPDQFVIYWASEALHTAIARKVIPGTLIEDRHLPYLKLAADADQLRTFMAKQGTQMLGETGPVFDRIP